MSDPFLLSVEAAPSKRNDVLKSIAIITMMIDHIGLMFFPQLMLFRSIGRIAFPIFTWQIVQGTIHTSSRPKYLFRLFLFGCISQIPYMFLNYDFTMMPLHLNIMFQLFTGVLIVISAECFVKTRRRSDMSSFLKTILSLFWLLATVFLILAPDILEIAVPHFRMSYGTYGQFMFLLFYVFRKTPIGQLIAYFFLSILGALESEVIALSKTFEMNEGLRHWIYFWTQPQSIWTSLVDGWPYAMKMDYYYFQTRSIVTLPIIWILKDQPWRFCLNRWVGYWFYPIHILVLVGLRFFLSQ